MIFRLVLILILPILAAWGIAFYMFRSGPLSDANWDGYGEVFLSYAIMFCIATWVPFFLFWLIKRSGGWRHEEE